VKSLRLLLTPSLVLLFACPSDDAGGNDTGNDDGNNTGDNDASSTASGSETAGTAPSDSSGGGDDSSMLECAADLPEDEQDGTVPGIMGEWGAACETDADCVAKVGEGGLCLKAAVIYELPLGYCSKACDLPDGFTGVVPDDPTCDAAGGVHCLGVDGTFEYCTVPCTENPQCERAGYFCRLMPQIAMETDPMFCLMPDCCDTDCSE
jgi:hypothetical protein